MKAIYAHVAGALTLSFAMGGCVVAGQPATPPPAPAQIQAPPPAPPAAVAPTPAPPVVTQVQYENYLDAPQTPGTWSYAADRDVTMAWYGNGGNELAADFVMLCRPSSREILLLRRGINTPGAMQIITETSVRILRVSPVPAERSAVSGRLAASDPFLDAMAITKGRFAVETEGTDSLYLPAWTEVSRVIEDCR